jgi:predicted metalloprotease
MTGIYMQAQFGEEAITRSDLQETRRVLSTYGDFEEENWDDPVAHGSGQQRVASFNIGYRNGFIGCGLDLDTWSTV